MAWRRNLLFLHLKISIVIVKKQGHRKAVEDKTIDDVEDHKIVFAKMLVRQLIPEASQQVACIECDQDHPQSTYFFIEELSLILLVYEKKVSHLLQKPDKPDYAPKHEKKHKVKYVANGLIPRVECLVAVFLSLTDVLHEQENREKADIAGNQD